MTKLKPEKYHKSECTDWVCDLKRQMKIMMTMMEDNSSFGTELSPDEIKSQEASV